MLSKKKSLVWKSIFLKTLFFYLFIFSSLTVYIYILSKDLPSLDELQKFNPQQVSKIVSADGVVINKLYTHKRDMVNISVIPVNLRNALFAMEDRDFYQHSGISIKATIRAVIVDVLTLSTRQGASTITQQLARNMYNSIGFKKTINRKLKTEKFISFQINNQYRAGIITPRPPRISACLFINSFIFFQNRFLSF